MRRRNTKKVRGIRVAWLNRMQHPQPRSNEEDKVQKINKGQQSLPPLVVMKTGKPTTFQIPTKNETKGWFRTLLREHQNI
jgi:hypothetical protein